MHSCTLCLDYVFSTSIVANANLSVCTYGSSKIASENCESIRTVPRLPREGAISSRVCRSHLLWIKETQCHRTKWGDSANFFGQGRRGEGRGATKASVLTHFSCSSEFRSFGTDNLIRPAPSPKWCTLKEEGGNVNLGTAAPALDQCLSRAFPVPHEAKLAYNKLRKPNYKLETKSNFKK